MWRLAYGTSPKLPQTQVQCSTLPRTSRVPTVKPPTRSSWSRPRRQTTAKSPASIAGAHSYRAKAVFCSNTSLSTGPESGNTLPGNRHNPGKLSQHCHGSLQSYRPSTAPCAPPKLLSPWRLPAGAFLCPNPLSYSRHFHRALSNNVSHMNAVLPNAVAVVVLLQPPCARR